MATPRGDSSGSPFPRLPTSSRTHLGKVPVSAFFSTGPLYSSFQACLSVVSPSSLLADLSDQDGFRLGRGVSHRNDEAGGCVGCGADGCGVVLLSEVRTGGRDGVFNPQGFSSALHHWFRAAIHFHSGKQLMDLACLFFHGSFCLPP